VPVELNVVVQGHRVVLECVTCAVALAHISGPAPGSPVPEDTDPSTISRSRALRSGCERLHGARDATRLNPEFGCPPSGHDGDERRSARALVVV
jgi:hypothetical protein